MPGLSFLNLKPWHPSNKINQKRIWIAEQEKIDREKRETEAALEILKEQEQESLDVALQMQRHDKQKSLKFMYNAPPGLKQGSSAEADEDDLANLAEDEAVRAFRQRLKVKKDPNFSATAQQSKLEKEAGIRHRSGMTIDEQVEKFPFLKGAPVEGDYAKNVQVQFKPLGKSLRNVRCMRCGEWGHKSGDRECPMANYNPHDLARQRREDPMMYMQTQLLQDKQNLILKRSALPQDMLGAEGMDGHQLLLSDEDEDADPEAAFLASLTTKEKKLLLHKIQQLEALTGSEDIVSDLGQIDPTELHATLTAMSREANNVKLAQTSHTDTTSKSRRSKTTKHRTSKSSKHRKRRRNGSPSPSDSGSSDSGASSGSHDKRRRR